MAEFAKAALPSTNLTLATLPFSSTTVFRTIVPCAPRDRASAGYFGGTLWISRFSAPLDERMIALLSSTTRASDETAGLSFLDSAMLAPILDAPDLFAAVWLTGVIGAEVDGATAAEVVKDGTGALAPTAIDSSSVAGLGGAARAASFGSRGRTGVATVAAIGRAGAEDLID